MNMRKSWLAILLGIFVILSGEMVGQKKLRLTDCFEIALANRSEIKNIDLELENSRKELTSAKQKPFPTLNASVNHNLNYNATDNPLLGQYAGNMSLTGRMPIFKWFNVWKKIQLANSFIDYRKRESDYQKLFILMSVTEQFFNLLLRHEQLMSAQQQVAITDTILQNTNELFKAGKIISTDVEESRLQFLREKKNVVNAENAFKQAFFSLKKSLQASTNIEIDFDYYSDKEPLNEILMTGYEAFEKRAINNNPYLKLFAVKKQQAEINYQIIACKNRPSLELNYSLSSNYSEDYLMNTNWDFYNNLKTSFRGGIGFTMTIPVFNRGNYATQKVIAGNEIQKIRNNLDLELSNLINLLNQQFLEAETVIKQYNLSERELESIKVILNDKSQLYKIGKENIFTVLNYKQQYNEILNNNLYLKYQGFMAINLLHLYVDRNIVGF
jgi:outer membrane protein TolC